MVSRLLVVGGLVTLMGCVVATVLPKPARIPGPIGRVDVVISSDVAEDRIARYRALDGDRVIREAVERELAAAGLWQPGEPVAVRITVTTFQLRSVANAMLSGVWAGDDELYGRIVVSEPAAAAREITFRFSSNDETYFKYSRPARFRTLVSTLAREIRSRVDSDDRRAAIAVLPRP